MLRVPSLSIRELKREIEAGRRLGISRQRQDGMIEFFFDCSSPWTYLAFHNIIPLAHEFDEAIEWRPILVGGIFNTINPSVYQSREKPVAAKLHYARKDLADWASLAGLKIARPTIFPVNSVKAMRGCILLEGDGKLVAFARAVFKAYWTDDRDIADANVLADICAQVGIDRPAFFAGISDQTIKNKLKLNTDELIERGGFGSPTMFLDRDDMYFGNDRLALLRAALERRRKN
jgi:2-hydroxychromene-2-carboxylate isomerase